MRHLNNVVQGRSRKLKDTDQADFADSIDPHGLCVKIQKSCEPCARTGSPWCLQPGIRGEVHAVESFWHWALGAGRRPRAYSATISQPPDRRRRQPTSTAAKSFATEPHPAMLLVVKIHGNAPTSPGLLWTPTKKCRFFWNSAAPCPDFLTEYGQLLYGRPDGPRKLSACWTISLTRQAGLPARHLLAPGFRDNMAQAVADDARPAFPAVFAHRLKKSWPIGR